MNLSNDRGNPSHVYDDAALEFLQEHMDKKQYDAIMSTKRGKALPYVAARVFLKDSEWQQYMWIVEHGSLDGFQKN